MSARRSYEGVSVTIASAAGGRVVISVPIDMDVNAERRNWLLAFIGDLGKWERLLPGIAMLAQDMGVSARMPSFTAARGFVYATNLLVEGNTLNVFLSLPTDERHRRESMGQPTAIDVSDVTSEADDVVKWRALMRSRDILKELLSSLQP